MCWKIRDFFYQSAIINSTLVDVDKCESRFNCSTNSDLALHCHEEEHNEIHDEYRPEHGYVKHLEECEGEGYENAFGRRIPAIIFLLKTLKIKVKLYNEIRQMMSNKQTKTWIQVDDAWRVEIRHSDVRAEQKDHRLRLLNYNDDINRHLQLCIVF